MYKSTNSSLNIKQKAKVKSKCTEYLTDRTFFDKTNDQYELEQLVKHFFLYRCILQKNMQPYCVKFRKILKI